MQVLRGKKYINEVAGVEKYARLKLGIQLMYKSEKPQYLKTSQIPVMHLCPFLSHCNEGTYIKSNVNLLCFFLSLALLLIIWTISWSLAYNFSALFRASDCEVAPPEEQWKAV